MKKNIVLTIGFLFLFMGITFAGSDKTKEITVSNVITVCSLEIDSSVPKMTWIDILVKATEDVEDFCNYFNGSVVDKMVKLYCMSGYGDAYTCFIYSAAKATCELNGLIRISIKGFEPSLKKIENMINNSTEVFSIVKKDGDFYLEKAQE